MEESNEPLCVGIDLGTSRSSISASNGERHVIDSYVGWPLDMVARKLIQKPILVGREALDSRSMLDLRRPMERGLIKDGSKKDVQRFAPWSECPPKHLETANSACAAPWRGWPTASCWCPNLSL